MTSNAWSPTGFYSYLRHRRSLAFIAIFLVFLSAISWNYQELSFGALSPLAGNTILPARHRKNIAVASRFPFHQDVYLALVQTLQQTLKHDGKVQVYARLPLPFGFSVIMDKFHLYEGSLKEYTDLIHDLTINPADGGIDMVILGTCEIDLRGDSTWVKDLLAAWDSREPNHKFQLVCIVHNIEDQAWHGTISDYSRRNAIRIVTISDHVAKSFHKLFLQRASSTDSVIGSAGYEYIPIDAFVPILDMPDIPSLPSNRILSNVVIPGTYSYDRRDYENVFRDLARSFHEDPRAWGYLPFGPGQSFVPDTSLDYPPFHLHLVGSGNIQVPEEINQVVVLHDSLDYDQFYALMGGMDICLPAFAEGPTYYEVQASSTIALCTEVNLPILATQQLREAYAYLDDRILIHQPAAMGSIHSIVALRTGNASAFLASDPSGSGIPMGSNPHVVKAVKDMLHSGWVRPKEVVEDLKRQIWSRNQAVVRELLNDQ